jgi:hypothetical protein
MGLFSGIVDSVKDVVGGISDFINPVTSVISGIGSAAQAVSPIVNYYGTQQTNEDNAQLAAENRAFQAAQTSAQQAFQERMSNTSYQRGIADMKAAGLNPMLGYSSSGASTPSGASASGAMATMQNALGAGVNTGFKASMNKATLDQMEEQNKNLRALNEQIHAQTDALDTQSALNKANELKSKADTMLSTNSAANAEVNNQLLKAQVPRATNEAKAQESWWMKNVSPYLPDFLKSVSGAGGAMRIGK